MDMSDSMSHCHQTTSQLMQILFCSIKPSSQATSNTHQDCSLKNITFTNMGDHTMANVWSKCQFINFQTFIEDSLLYKLPKSGYNTSLDRWDRAKHMFCTSYVSLCLCVRKYILSQALIVHVKKRLIKHNHSFMLQYATGLLNFQFRIAS